MENKNDFNNKKYYGIYDNQLDYMKLVSTSKEKLLKEYGEALKDQAKDGNGGFESGEEVDRCSYEEMFIIFEYKIIEISKNEFINNSDIIL